MLRSLIDAFIRALLFAETDRCDQPLDAHYTAADLSPALRLRIAAECAQFLDQAHDTLVSVECARQDASVYESAGHDFLLTRNGHGCGFWDGDWPEDAGSALTDLARSFKELAVYVGDDGKIYSL
jgi:hypothetical protein